MTLKAGYAQCTHCNAKDAYSLIDDAGKGICIGHLKKPKKHKLDKYSICFIDHFAITTRFAISRSELLMISAAGGFLILLEEIGKWNK